MTSASSPSSRASSQERGASKDGLRGRVEQQVDAIAGSANKVITGVVDTSFGMLKSLLPNNTNAPATIENVQGSAPWNAVRPGFGLLRRESVFSIKSMLPGSTPKLGGEEELITVSRPGSVRSRRSRAGSVKSRVYASSDDDSEEAEEDDSEESKDDEDEEADYSPPTDTRSIKSFESMMSSKKKRRRKVSRPSLSDRLASVSALTAKKVHASFFLRYSVMTVTPQSSPPPSRGASILPATHRFDSPVAESPAQGRLSLAPPNKRFLDCEVDDLKMSEVAELLREYRRVVEGVRAIGGFEPE